MCRKILFFLVILISFNLKALAAVFTVTSNADSGPGTLRDALTQAAANGSATTDYIYFNLPDTSQAGRTITLQSTLPAISSNLIIDGTTQAGAGFSPGDARIIITVNIYNYIDNTSDGAFTLQNVHGVEIYGLLFTGFNELRNPYGSFNPYAAAIEITASQNITIGSPGKGNSFKDNNYEILAGPSNGITGGGISNVVIQGNYFGFNDPNQSFAPSGVSITGNSLTIGGDNGNEGNHFAVTLTISGDTVKISHNSFGLSLNGTFEGGTFEDIACSSSSGVEVSYNTSFILRATFNSVKNFNIYANVDINTDASISSAGIGMGNCSDGTIGSDDIKLRNVFRTNTGETVDQISATLVNYSSNNIQVLKNEIICSRMAYYINLQPTDNIIVPSIKVLVNNATEYSGTASPNAKIYVYQDTTDCPVCSPVKFDTILTADANGSWKMTGNLTGKKWVSNAWLSKNSSEFTQPLFSYLDDYYDTIQPSCGKNNGSISITADFKNIINFEWYNSNNQKIGVGPVLKNVGPGTYYAKGFNGICFARSVDFFLYDVSPAINSVNVTTKNPSCGAGGSITGLLVNPTSNNPLTTVWTDINNKTVSSALDATDLPQGVYLFTLTDAVTKCSVTYGPVTLRNTTGPNIDQSNATKQATNCGQSTGSITGITATGTGTLKYTWLNSQQQTVGTSLDLLNQPTGAYKLEVTDDSQCGPVYTTDLTIPETNGITMDESKAQPAAASCNNNNGSVTGITVTGATQYQWLDANNKVVGTAADLQNVAPGTYTLTASNTFGCAATSKPYTVGQQPPTKFPVYAATSVPACFQSTDGSVTVAVDALVKSVRWVNASGQDAGPNAALTNVAAGTYQLYLTDQNGCENYYNTYTIDQLPQFAVTDNGATVNDQCTLGTGSISGVTVAGGAPPYAYTWYDASNTVIGTGISISNLSAGVYTLSVTDTRCGNAKITYTLTDESEEVAAPSVSNVALCSSGNAIISVNNPLSSTIYRLYANLTDTQPLAEQKGGRFVVSATGNTSFYISQLNGSCESSRAEVKVTVGLSALNIANTFTPNGDGINDFWVINDITNYPAAEVQVFTRNGQRIFDSKGYATPFDGTFDGKKLPEGVYYYIIDLHSNCSLLSGSLTIIR